MLPLKVVEEVKQLLDEGCHSQRRIAEILGVSRGTVQAIASGKRGLHGREPDPDSDTEESTPVRCPGCGARVYMPCVLCQARAFAQHRESSKWLSAPGPRRVA